MFTKIKNAFSHKENQQIALIIGILFILINIMAWGTLRPYAKRPPCAICGRANTKPVKTLYQYRVEVVPYMKDVQIWYCKRHIKNAPEIVTEMPVQKDTVASRYRIAVIAGLFALFSVFFIVILLEMNFRWLFIHPGVIAAAYILCGVTSNLTVVILLVSTVALAAGIFYFWNRWLNKY
jgi:hypothetical protein